LHLQLPDAPLVELPAKLADLVINRDKTGVTLRYDPSDTDVGSILESRFRIGDVTTAQPGLEDVFIELVEQN
jgi:hypothetical protein